ncbi:helicase SKI2W [Coccinella septempunctata]|uniref:helicase SKI2W n=1 Tax=Coccinella septempunctata TaxID=41139 RepID=UPI001D068C27|nr:helicase SKI2W [Coccinella septempunctata]
MSPKRSDLSILPDIEKKLEQFATGLENFSIYEYERCQIHWEREQNPLDLLYFEGSPMSTTLKVQRDPFTGKIVDFHEVPLEAVGATPMNSMLLNRAPIPSSKAVRGSSSFIPFLPGSFLNDSFEIPKSEELPHSELLTVPPGFSTGLTFDIDGRTVLEETIEVEPRKIPEQKHIINLVELAQKEQDSLGSWGNTDAKSKDESDHYNDQMHSEEEAIIPKEPLVLDISKAQPLPPVKGTEWAVLLDASKPITDFHEKIPKMAREYPFELDNFQKLAILQVEQHNHVFVAAHTSAGKTVVAEYAIALSQQHRTKTIYTSPIKALSNQKYRDFKKEFEDVGLITGDFQTNETASCLIMTTEILRSMLYCGSDTTRDLEYVIFDEVHYINDRERGHVWEQVLIMLPENVSVILLSATVPKPEEFADWLGRTYQKKVYVITTPKRPVPLHHFLYTGTDGKTRDNKYAILNDDQWCMEGYALAKLSMADHNEKRAGNERRQFTEKQDKTLWVALIAHLQKENLLPVVAFTFSRFKCDRNAINLHSIDLTTAKEKRKIRGFYQKCIRNLSEADRNVPQVMIMDDILSRGIGVHHSGVLPIIKEIVEMLFQKELIKILFATETFAMGVNMPARTVIFDSITKHDGKEWRTLEPAEYIQMAGRAGRRQHDKEGTVIILCKNNLPAETTLKDMMMGRPQSLKSQFRLTYGMVLGLLRTEKLSVEGMMSRSFLEADHQKKMVAWKQKLADVEKEINDLCKDELNNHLQPLVAYFDSANAYLKQHKLIMSTVMCHSKVQKVMTPGRVLLICWKNHINKLAILLSVARGNQQYKVLILSEKDLEKCKLDEKTLLWYKMISLASMKIYCPTGNVDHELIDIEPSDILEITGKVIKTTPELIISDWNKRMQPRFRNDPPGQTVSKATQELHKLTLSANNSDVGILQYSHFLRDLHVRDSELYLNLEEMYLLKEKVHDTLFSTQIPNFVEHFSIVFSKKYLEEERDTLKFLLSKSSLALYPDYQSRIKLLKHFEYVDNDNIVKMKGKVACQMGMNELLITELITRNVLGDLKPAQVAALLSTMVFQVRSRNKEEVDDILKGLEPPLQKAIAHLKKIHEEILSKEEELQIRSVDIQEELNFGVVDIVHEWASKKSFAEIMQHTEYQEGIIVRCIQQLNDTICDVRDAAKTIGNIALRKKMEEASNAIKRDIVFAASLYTQAEANYV